MAGQFAGAIQQAPTGQPPDVLRAHDVAFDRLAVNEMRTSPCQLNGISWRPNTPNTTAVQRSTVRVVASVHSATAVISQDGGYGPTGSLQANSARSTVHTLLVARNCRDAIRQIDTLKRGCPDTLRSGNQLAPSRCHDQTNRPNDAMIAVATALHDLEGRAGARLHVGRQLPDDMNGTALARLQSHLVPVTPLPA